MKNSDQEIIGKLDQFIRKYYKNRLIRGIIWSLSITTVFFLLFVLLEYYFYFDKYIRAALFFLYSGLLSFALIRLVVFPAFQLLRIGKLIGYEQAASIIGDHFTEIQDKLLNTLQLIRQNKALGENNDLLAASIEQKTRVLKVFPFSMAIDFRKNLKYIRFALIPVAIILLLTIFTPSTISDPTKRIVRFNETFVKPLPYKIELLNKKMIALQKEDFEIRVKITGEEIPASVFIKSGEILYKMNNDKGFKYSYTFKSIQSDINFKVIAGELTSGEFKISVVPRPIILNFDLVLNYPEYTGKKDEIIDNQGDVVIPEGTSIRWNFYTKDVSDVIIKFTPEIILARDKSGNRFSFTGSPLKNVNYSIKPVNGSVALSDSLLYRVMVINDGYPSIFITENNDSVLPTNLFFKGAIKDDYGFSGLSFNYCVFNKQDSAGTVFTKTEIPIASQFNNQVFYYSIDLVKLLPDPGKQILYYFEIKDNDQVHGPKTTRSEMRTIKTPTLDEISDKTELNAEFVNDELKKSITDAKAIKKNIDELNKKLIDQDNISWQEKKKLEDMLKGAEEIQKRVDEIKRKSEENINNEEKYLETSERIVEKQKKLNEMMDKLLSEDLKKMIEELKALMNQVDKTKLGNLLEKMKMSNKELENQLDRNLALMKQIEFDRKLEETVKELRKTADSLDNLAKKTESTNDNLEKILEKQKEINKDAESLSEKIKELIEQSKKLDDPVDLGNTEKLQDSLKKNLAESKNSLEGKNKKKAAEKQKKAAENMKQLADQMESANEEAEDAQTAEDAQNIRIILENLVRLSFDQENLINQTKQIAKTDPRYLELIVRQKEFSGKMKIIEDSLNAIARRNLDIKPIISKEIIGINQNVEYALESFEARNINAVVIRQQYAMTSINNLALLLNESLEKMNQQMSSSMQSKSGNKSCNNPNSKGGKKKSAKDLKDMQGKIGEQLKKMKEGMDGAKKTGNSKSSENKGLSKEIAKLAAQQEALRNEMQKYQEELNAKGIKDGAGLKDAAREMEQNEKDLVNKQITQETMMRQQRILSRLLESEKAEQTREREDRRESIESKNQKTSNLGKDFEYNKEKRGSLDQLQYMLPSLRSFYRSKVNNYVVKIEQ